MKSTKVLLAITVVAIVFLCSVSTVLAQSSTDASASVIWVTQPIRPGDTASVILTVTSNTANSIVISRLGLHFDWMEAGQYYTSDFSGSPVTVPGNSAHAFDTLAIQIPPYATPGSHSFSIAIDGTLGGNPFSWDSEIKTIEIASGTTTAAPSGAPSSSPGSGDGANNSLDANTLAIIATVVVVLVALVVVVMWTRRRKSKSAAPAVASQSDAAKPEEKPAAAEQKPATPEEKPTTPATAEPITEPAPPAEKPATPEEKPAAPEEKPTTSPEKDKSEGSEYSI